MAAALDEPLGALIVSVRNNSGNASSWFTLFNVEADKILPVIELDTSKNANLIRSAITDVRLRPYELDSLERTRRMLVLEVT